MLHRSKLKGAYQLLSSRGSFLAPTASSESTTPPAFRSSKLLADGAIHLSESFYCYSMDDLWTTNIKSFSNQLLQFKPQLKSANSSEHHVDRSEMMTKKQRCHEQRSGGDVASRIASLSQLSRIQSLSPGNRNISGDTFGPCSSRPHVEHQECGSTRRISSVSVAECMESLSADELHIVSELSQALSIPEDVRKSLQEYLHGRHRADALPQPISRAGVERPLPNSGFNARPLNDLNIKTSPKVKTKVASKGLPCVKEDFTKSDLEFLDFDLNGHPFTIEQAKIVPKRPKQREKLWTEADLGDPDRIKEVLDKVPKIIAAEKIVTFAKATEMFRQMKETSYIATMASFVELCVSTGMVSVAIIRCFDLILKQPSGSDLFKTAGYIL